MYRYIVSAKFPTKIIKLLVSVLKCPLNQQVFEKNLTFIKNVNHFQIIELFNRRMPISIMDLLE